MPTADKVITKKYGSTPVIDGESLNGATPDTGWVDVRGANSLCLDNVVTNGGSASELVWVFEHKREGSADVFYIPEIAAGGVVTPVEVTHDLTDGLKFSTPINVADYDFVRGTATGTGATAGDELTSNAYVTRD